MTAPNGVEPEPYAGPWHCICGSGDGGEWHSLMCAISNTPDDVWDEDDTRSGSGGQR